MGSKVGVTGLESVYICIYFILILKLIVEPNNVPQRDSLVRQPTGKEFSPFGSFFANTGNIFGTSKATSQIQPGKNG